MTEVKNYLHLYTLRMFVQSDCECVVTIHFNVCSFVTFVIDNVILSSVYCKSAPHLKVIYGSLVYVCVCTYVCKT